MPPRYVPLIRLSVGAHADVYLGVLRGACGFERPVVLKRAFAGIRGDANDAREQLLREANISFAVAHPHNASAVELTEIPEGLVLVFEYLAGTSLHSLIAHLRREDALLPPAIACAMIADAAFGLAHAHRRTGEAHGDVSPRNLVLTDMGFVKVIDYGNISEGSRRATPAYASPEQAQGQPPSRRSDVFSLMLVLRELLTGSRAFQGDDVGDVLQQVAIASLPSLGGSLAPIDDILRQGLARDPRHREGDLERFGESLRALAGGEGTRRQIRLFLDAEMGPILRQRARRVDAALAGRASDAPPTQGTQTTSALDAFFGELPEGTGTLVDSATPR